tara:strand:+ start:248 stop:430 length:183 start_codon:yes stop_codon:yes gene_type:complete
VFGPENIFNSTPECQLEIMKEIIAKKIDKNRKGYLPFFRIIDKKHEKIIKKWTHLCHKHI